MSKPGGYLVTPEDVCFVCQRSFSSDSALRPHDHHIIPKSYGGVDGPMARLCSGHHDLVHSIAKRLISEKSHYPLTQDISDPDLLQRLMFLASRIQLAHAALANDPEKKLIFTASLKKEVHDKLNALCKYHHLNKNDMLRVLIEKAYSSIFQSI